jgi:hypothetical protein
VLSTTTSELKRELACRNNETSIAPRLKQQIKSFVRPLLGLIPAMLRPMLRRSSIIYSIRVAVSRRAFHAVTADFVRLGPDGQIVTSQESIRIGDPGEAYVLIPPENRSCLSSC